MTNIEVMFTGGRVCPSSLKALSVERLKPQRDRMATTGPKHPTFEWAGTAVAIISLIG